MIEPVAIPRHPAASRGLWIAAATIAVSFHLALAALAYVSTQRETDSDDLGAPGIAIGFELTSPQTQPSDLPPGPDAEASVASPAVAEQKAEMKEADLRDTPVEAERADQQARVDTKDKPDDETPDVKVKTQASEESVAQEATASPSVPDATEAQTSTTIDQGTGASRERARVTWQKELLAHFDKHKKYPSDRSRKAARILLSLVLDRMGQVMSVGIIESSGDEAFDEAARWMVRRANPVPRPPALVADEGLSFTLPVVFRLRDKR
jgi:periplasmic protein TonB